MTTQVTPSQAAQLVAAYHAVYDIKDTLTPGSTNFQTAGLACMQIDALMSALGVPEVRRFDADRPRAETGR